MASTREYGAAIFSPGLGEVLLVKYNEDSGWAFPFTHTTESDIHVVAAASAVRQILGIDIGDKISRTHWIEAEFPQTGALVRLYVALGVRPEAAVPRCADGAVAQWHPLRSILPPVNAILRADHSAAAANGDDDEEGGGLVLEAGIAPFLAKLKALLNKHPEWRISQLDPNITRLIQDALTFVPISTTAPYQQQQQGLGAVQQLQRQPQQQQAPHDLGAGQQAEEHQQDGGEPVAQAKGTALQQEGAEAAHAAEGCTHQPERQGELQEGQRQSSQPEGVEGAEAALAEGVGAVKVKEDCAIGSGEVAGSSEVGAVEQAETAQTAAATEVMAAGGAGRDVDGEAGSGADGGWRGPQAQEHLLEYCRLNDLPEPCYSLVVKKSARRPLVTASCILAHLGVQITPDMHVPGGIHAACQAAALAAILWLEGALPPDGGEAVRVVPVGWPPLLSEARGESWEAAQLARRAGGARRELDTVQREALLREMDKKRQRLVAEAAELERLMEALRGGGGFPEPDLTQLTASLGLGGNGGANEVHGNGGGGGDGAAPVHEPSVIMAAAEAGEAAPEQAPARVTNLQASAGGGGARGAKRGATGGDGSTGLTGLAVGLRALKFRSGSDNLGPGGTPRAGSGSASGRGNGAGGGRAPGTKRPRDDGQPMGSQGGEAGAVTPSKNVVMELKELCDRKRWPQPQYAFKPGAGPGAAAVVTLPPAAGLREVSSGPQSNRKRAKEAAAAAALAQLSALGLK